jgi:hypothetical protein
LDLWTTDAIMWPCEVAESYPIVNIQKNNFEALTKATADFRERAVCYEDDQKLITQTASPMYLSSYLLSLQFHVI